VGGDMVADVADADRLRAGGLPLLHQPAGNPLGVLHERLRSRLKVTEERMASHP